VIEDTATLQVNRDFSKDMRININDLRWICFWDWEDKDILKREESGGESVTA
jgi:hypothetical protein